MPAAAVIPTPKVSMMDAAVKKSVVIIVERIGNIVYLGER